MLAIGSCLLAAPLDAKEGDLDPTFGDVGRVGPIASVPGIAWSIYSMKDGSLVVAGGDVSLVCPPDNPSCNSVPAVGYAARSFLIRVSNAGQLLESHEIAATNFHLLAIARQSDGKFLAAGRRLYESSRQSRFVVYRLNQDGSPDTGFGANGLVQLPAAVRGAVDEATALLVEDDGRIVVTGSIVRSGQWSQILIRLLTNGDFDQAFGSSGIVVLPGRRKNSPQAVQAPLYGTQVVRTDAGAYRVSVPNRCQVVGLTPDGTFDPAFGSSGTVQIHHPISNACSLRIAMQADGRLVVGASDGEAAVVTRLLADGQPDPSFLIGTGIEDRVGNGRITALAVRPAGSIVVALGPGDFDLGRKIKQLLPSGELDESFGNAGSTEIDMPSEFGSFDVLFDMLVREGGTVVGAGGNPFASQSHGPIIVRLLGAGAGDSPGILTVRRSGGWLRVDEQLADASVEVRRTGGDAGRVSVAYQVFADEGESAATAGEDFVADAGRLEWEDGDATNQSIRVRIFNDDLPEYSERITVLLTDAEGGAGLGQAGQIIEILANDGAKSVISFANGTRTVGEASTYVTLDILRSDPADRAVSVDYSTASGTATAGSDFTSASSTLSWAAGDLSRKTIRVYLNNDTIDEGDETFNVRLLNPSAGATLGSVSTATITIADDDAPDGGGASALGFASTGATIDEAGGSIVLSVGRSGDASGAVSVDYSTVSGTATAGSDFTSASGTLTWADGDSTDKTFTVNITTDTTDESDETFTVILSNPTSGATLGQFATVSVSIVDDDAGAGGAGGVGGSGGGGGAFGAWSLAFLYGLIFAGNVQRRRKRSAQTGK